MRKPLNFLQKGVDKMPRVWYNKDTKEREEEQHGNIRQRKEQEDY